MLSGEPPKQVDLSCRYTIHEYISLHDVTCVNLRSARITSVYSIAFGLGGFRAHVRGRMLPAADLRIRFYDLAVANVRRTWHWRCVGESGGTDEAQLDANSAHDVSLINSWRLTAIRRCCGDGRVGRSKELRAHP